MQKILLIGGLGNITASTILALLERDDEVAVFTHPKSSPVPYEKEVRYFFGDRSQIDALKNAVDTFQPDVVIDSICYTLAQATPIPDLLWGKTGQYIFISTVDVYGYPLSRIPMRETDPYGLPNCRYAEEKRACEEYFLSRHDPKNFPLTIARPSYSFGNRFVISFFAREAGRFMVARLKAGKPVLVPGDGTTLMHASTASNTGRMIARIAGHKAAIGKSYTCAHDTIITQNEYVQLFAGVLGVEPNIVHIPKDILTSVETSEMKSSIYGILTAFDRAFSIETFCQDFPGFQWKMSLEEAARRYVDYQMQENRLSDTGDELFENRLLSTWLRSREDFLGQVNAWD